MNKKSLSPICWLSMISGLTLALFCPKAYAAWSSVRANNRSSAESHIAPRGQRTPGAEHEQRAATALPPREEARRENREVISRGSQVRGREEAARPRGEIERAQRDRRHFDWDADHRHTYFWSYYHPGYVINTLPPGYISTYAAGTPYYYYDGVFYQPGTSGYMVVNPPLGAAVGQLPPGAEGIAIGPYVYYYAGSAFYQQTADGFIVVAPPIGATVSTLPTGAVPVNINGRIYYQVDGAYFLPVMQDGTTVYEVVQP